MHLAVHIPKTAGTSFRIVIQKLYKKDICYDYTDNYNLSDEIEPSRFVNFKRKWHYRKFRQALRENDKCIYGHYRVSKYLSLCPSEITLFLRDPVERTISHYYFWRKNPDLLNSTCKLLIKQNLNLEDFAALPLLQNFQSKFVHGLKISEIPFVGLTEHFDDCLNYFCVHHGISTPNKLEPKMVNQNRVKMSEIEPSVINKIRALNTTDLRLYEEAQEIAIKKNIIS